MYITVLVSVSILAYTASYFICIRSIDLSFGLDGLLKVVSVHLYLIYFCLCHPTLYEGVGYAKCRSLRVLI